MNISRLLLLLCLLLCVFLQGGVSAEQSLLYNEYVDTVELKGVALKDVEKAVNGLELQTVDGVFLRKRFLESDLQALYATGYFSQVLAYSTVSKNRHIVTIDCFPNLTIEQVSVRGLQSKLEKRVSELLSMRIGSPMNSRYLDGDRARITGLLQVEGYDFFEISSMAFDKESATLEVFANEGVIESVEFKGLSAIQKRVLLREMSQKKGEVFNSKQLRQDREQLLQLGYFNAISPPSFSQGNSANAVRIVFNVEEKKVNKIEFGIEQERDLERYSGFVSNIRNHIVMHSDVLLLKTQVQVQNEELDFSSYSVKYSQPWLLNRFRLSGAAFFYSREVQELLNSETTYSRRQGYQFSLSYPLTYRFRLTAQLNQEEVSAVDSSDGVDPYSLNAVALNLNYRSTRSLSNPKSGMIFDATLEKGDELGFLSLGGLSFLRYSASLSSFVPVVSSKRLVLATRFQGGAFLSEQENLGSTTYENDTFIIGGSSSLRGYNELNNPFSGVRKLLFNGELRYDLTTALQGVLFYDYGNAFFSTVDLEDFQSGYGVGMRYITPVGPIRLDLARGGDHFFLHIGLGQLF